MDGPKRIILDRHARCEHTNDQVTELLRVQSVLSNVSEEYQSSRHDTFSKLCSVGTQIESLQKQHTELAEKLKRLQEDYESRRGRLQKQCPHMGHPCPVCGFGVTEDDCW